MWSGPGGREGLGRASHPPPSGSWRLPGQGVGGTVSCTKTLLWHRQEKGRNERGAGGICVLQSACCSLHLSPIFDCTRKLSLLGIFLERYLNCTRVLDLVWNFFLGFLLAACLRCPWPDYPWGGGRGRPALPIVLYHETCCVS